MRIINLSSLRDKLSHWIFQQVEAEILVDASPDFQELLKEGNSHDTV